MRTLLTLILLAVFFAPATALGQALPNNSEKSDKFREEINRIEQQIRDQNLDPKKLSVGYEFTTSSGETFTLSEGENPWSVLYQQPEFFGQPEDLTKTTESRPEPTDSLDPDTATASDTETAEASEESGWSLLTGIGGILTGIIVVIIIVFVVGGHRIDGIMNENNERL